MIIGLSGLFVGLTLVVALPNMAGTDVAFGDEFVIVIPLYGLAATLGGIGTWRRSWVGWTLAAAVDALGLGVLIWAVTLAGPDRSAVRRRGVDADAPAAGRPPDPPRPRLTRSRRIRR